MNYCLYLYCYFHNISANMSSSLLRVFVKLRNLQQTPEEGWRIYRPKCCVNNNKDEDNSLKTLNDKNHQASFQKKSSVLAWHLSEPISVTSAFLPQNENKKHNFSCTVIKFWFSYHLLTCWTWLNLPEELPV